MVHFSPFYDYALRMRKKEMELLWKWKEMITFAQ